VTVLAIVTSTSQVGVALHGPAGPVAAMYLRQGRRHGETVAPAIESLLRLSQVSVSELSLLAVDAGPGLFTGLRVGVATAKALASALRIPLAAGSSLDLLAHPHRHGGRAVLSAVDARRGEVFWALYRPVAAAMARIGEPSVSPPAELAALLEAMVAEHGPVLLTGDGARRYEALLGRFTGVELAPPDCDHPSAEVLAAVAGTLRAGEAAAVTPLYLRGADVRIGWEQRGA